MEWVTWVDAHPNGERLAIGMEKGRTFIWDLAANRAVHTIERSDFVVNTRWSPDGERLVVAEMNGKVSVYDPEWQAVAEVETPFKQLRTSAFAADGRWFMAGGRGARAQIFDTETWERAYEAGNSKYDITAVGLVGDQLAFGYATGWLEGYTDRGETCVAAGEALPWAVSSLAVHPSQKGVIYGGSRGGMQGVEIEKDDWRPGHQWRGDPPRPIAANSISFSPDGERFVVACSDDAARVFDWPRGVFPDLLGQPFHYREPKPEWSQSMIVSSACWAPAGDIVFTSHYDGHVRAWRDDGHYWKEETTITPRS